MIRILTTALAACLIGHAAFAHAHLQTAVPAAGSTVTVTPSELVISYTEGVEPKFSTIAVTGPDGKRVDQGDAHLVGGDSKQLAVGLASGLPPGAYTVAWRVTSVDTHKSDGSFQFTLASADASGISVEGVWARASAGAATSGAIYLTLTDHGQADRLVSVSTPVAATAEVHESIDDHGVMKMRPVGNLALEPGKPVTFKPGGYHVMLMGLKAPLKAGDSFPLTLNFEHAQPMTVTVSVQAAGAGAPMHGPGGMPGMQGMEDMHGQMQRKP